MTARYVHRREDGTIASVHGEPQKGYAEEELAEDAAELVAWLAAANAPKVPASVRSGQLILALDEMGKLEAVDGAVEAHADYLGKMLWRHASRFDRDDPRLVAIGAAVGLNAAALDDLFRLAATK